MPLAQLKGLSGYLSPEQKAEPIRMATDAIVSMKENDFGLPPERSNPCQRRRQT